MWPSLQGSIPLSSLYLERGRSWRKFRIESSFVCEQPSCRSLRGPVLPSQSPSSQSLNGAGNTQSMASQPENCQICKECLPSNIQNWERKLFQRYAELYQKLTLEHFQGLKRSSADINRLSNSYSHIPVSSPGKPLIYFFLGWISLFWTFHVNGIIQRGSLLSSFFHLAQYVQDPFML